MYSIDKKLNNLLKKINFEDSNSSKINLFQSILINKLLNRDLISENNPSNLSFDPIRKSQASSHIDSNHAINSVDEIDPGFMS